VATIYIDNQPYTVENEERSLLEVCLSLGINLPYFCWHPALRSVGACRQCAVLRYRDAQDTRGRIAMACMLPAKDGTRISINAPTAVAFRAGVIEWLMSNHPHDCPVCDEGGECHLQDMTVMTGHVYRRYRFKKRSYRNQNLGPFVNHELNRCIQCYRCVRFYRDFAGGRDFNVFSWHDNVYFGRFQDGVLESPFSGNLVEVCPTGVFTDKTLKKHYTRKWDLQTAPSLCTLCGVGCNIIPGERYGMLRRIHNRFNGQVNGYFLCDRGRYGYEFVNSPQRIRAPRIRDGEAWQSVSHETALHAISEHIRRGRTIGIGSSRASLEANFALRTLVGAGNFFLGVSEASLQRTRAIVDILAAGLAHTPSQQEMARADVVLILGEDVTHTAPMLALAVRQAAMQGPMRVVRELHVPKCDDAAVREAIQQERSPFFIATTDATRIDELATSTFRAAPEDIARLGFAVARAIDASAPTVPDLTDELRTLAATIAQALLAGERPLILSGYGCGSVAVAQAAANVAWALTRKGIAANLAYTVPDCNSVGAVLLGDGNLDDALNAVRTQAADTLIVLENDLYRQADAATVDALFAAVPTIIALDHLEHPSTGKATIVLPAATFAEADGTLLNHEGRAQRFYQVFVPQGEIQPSWRWLSEMMVAAGKASAPPWATLDDLLQDIANTIPALAAIRASAPPESLRMHDEKIPRQPHRYSGRTAMLANVTVFEPPPPVDPDTPLAFSMEGYQGKPPPPLIPRFWSPGWNSVQSVNKFQQEVGGPLRGGDPGVQIFADAAAAAPSYFRQIPLAFRAESERWYLLPAYHIFGSEELSVLTPGIAAQAPQAYLALGRDDAARLGLTDGRQVSVSIGGVEHQLPVQIHAALPAGVALLPVGLATLPGLQLPAWGRITVREGRP
jgi:NADH-quinone oxidoreductase subunit G